MVRFRRTRIKLRILLCELTRRPREVVRRHQFNLWAENGWADYLDSPHGPLTERALERMRLSPGDRFLDLGCGGGLASRMIASTLDQSSLVVGLDISDEMVRRARAKSRQFRNLVFICGSAESIPLADDFFSAILCVEAFYYFERPEQVLRELLRVTAPLGQLCLVLCLYSDHPLSLLTVESVNVPLLVWSAAEYKQLLERVGWVDVQVEDFVQQPKLGRKLGVHDRALFINARKPGHTNHVLEEASGVPRFA